MPPPSPKLYVELYLPCPDCDETGIVEYVLDHSPGCFYLDECMGKPHCPIFWDYPCQVCVLGMIVVPLEITERSQHMLKLQRHSTYAIITPAKRGSNYQICQGPEVITEGQTDRTGDDITLYMCRLIADLGLNVDPYNKEG